MIVYLIVMAIILDWLEFADAVGGRAKSCYDGMISWAGGDGRTFRWEKEHFTRQMCWLRNGWYSCDGDNWLQVKTENYEICTKRNTLGTFALFLRVALKVVNNFHESLKMRII